MKKSKMRNIFSNLKYAKFSGLNWMWIFTADWKRKWRDSFPKCSLLWLLQVIFNTFKTETQYSSHFSKSESFYWFNWDLDWVLSEWFVFLYKDWFSLYGHDEYTLFKIEYKLCFWMKENCNKNNENNASFSVSFYHSGKKKTSSIL